MTERVGLSCARWFILSAKPCQANAYARYGARKNKRYAGFAVSSQ